MDAMREIRRRGRHVVGPVFGALLLGYFVYHAVQGDRGILAWRQVDQQIALAEAALAEVSGVREQMERRVALLEPTHIDPDMLEERARIMLNLAHPDEIVILRAGAKERSGMPASPMAPGDRTAASTVARLPVN
ncbi:MAG: septum formation initiator family protein [Alphaproteobacteria bacterium]|nr:septum formation initiator family protein [Alphaproteobacteria bacterium]MBU0797779.1 septum formation initiator family protein [Alphaproteobacteria bacterium]MBU0887841.1 septum formation initiator family protein [Alphaproteobacteria bacterium]MBU1814936.1 septum formation initiator family protein [Alphaproteobacteria bacterium]